MATSLDHDILPVESSAGFFRPKSKMRTLALVVAGVIVHFVGGAPISEGHSKVDNSVQGRQGQTLSGDGLRDVRGSYTIALPGGRTRTVKYSTGESNLHAAVITNELGAESTNPQDVALQASAVSAAEAVLKGAATFLRSITFGPDADGVYVQRRVATA
ncbi:uncharacterized protein LOC111271059 isoform X1 [Varroa jacobsoni]|uniref:Uncharacterized protein n=1 Tax=Varroa destructor TaxID=109461 RepID=A0A7M7JQJ0_VARDE|nr:uncharacterized protein LOC111248091 isoform X1 [Varroa destructor]XP_022707368.1 uncharacterized protein LOC111271059 isoform X1 [Varroa jacobsoni]